MDIRRNSIRLCTVVRTRRCLTTLAYYSSLPVCTLCFACISHFAHCVFWYFPVSVRRVACVYSCDCWLCSLLSLSAHVTIGSFASVCSLCWLLAQERTTHSTSISEEDQAFLVPQVFFLSPEVQGGHRPCGGLVAIRDSELLHIRSFVCRIFTFTNALCNV